MRGLARSASYRQTITKKVEGLAEKDGGTKKRLMNENERKYFAKRLRMNREKENQRDTEVEIENKI